MSYPENSISAARVARHEERQTRREDWKEENKRREAALEKPLTYSQYVAKCVMIEVIALKAAEDYSKEGSLSEKDVDLWARDFAKRYVAGENS